MNEFEKRFKNYDNHKLAKIINNAKNHHQDAVKAAEAEISSRGLSSSQIKAVLVDLRRVDSKKEELKNKSKKAIEGTNTFAAKAIDVISPVKKSHDSLSNSFKSIAAFFSLVLLIKVYSEFGLLVFMITSPEAEWGLDMVVYYIPLLVLLTGVILFWMRAKYGWVLISSYTVFMTTTMLISIIKWREAIEGIIPLALIGVFIWLLASVKIRRIFSINERDAIITLAVAITASIAMILIID